MPDNSDPRSDHRDSHPAADRAPIDEAPPTIRIVVHHTRRLAVPAGIRIRRVARVPATSRLAGLPLTDRASSMLDHLADLTDRRAATLLDRALQHGWLNDSDLRERLAHKAWGNGRLRRLAGGLSAGAASAFEAEAHSLLRRSRIDGWTPNFAVWDNEMLAAVIDIAFEEARLAIELDGRAYHVDAVAFQRDRSRQNRLVALGWRVLRFTWDDIKYRQGYVLATIRGELRHAA